jgi:hypothetical protein
MRYLVMPTSEKTYTFRGAEDLVPRVREAFAVFGSVLDDDGGREEAMVLWTAVSRRRQELARSENQSALLRATLEVFIEAAEKLERDREHLHAYEEWAAEDEEAHAVREGALEAAADRWRE